MRLFKVLSKLSYTLVILMLLNINSSYAGLASSSINKQIYEETSNIWCPAYITKVYNSDSKAYKSYLSNLDPLQLMAISCNEWGGNALLSTSLCPAVASRYFKQAGLDISHLRVAEVNSYFYAANNIDVNFADKSYLGPLQITKYSFEPNNQGNVKYVPNDKPVDPYSWNDSCKWYAMNISHYVNSCWDKNYIFKDKYVVLCHLSVMANTGQSYMAGGANFGNNISKPHFPWKNAKAMFNYIDAINSTKNRNVIINIAESEYRHKLSLVESGKSDTINMQYTLPYAYKNVYSKLDIDLSKYLKPEYVKCVNGDISNSKNRSVTEKVMHPITAMIIFHQLELFYRDE